MLVEGFSNDDKKIKLYTVLTILGIIFYAIVFALFLIAFIRYTNSDKYDIGNIIILIMLLIIILGGIIALIVLLNKHKNNTEYEKNYLNSIKYLSIIYFVSGLILVVPFIYSTITINYLK
jgi:glucan phosphoethanolaminetransferase (alkaline phosphatase superfamily)